MAKLQATINVMELDKAQELVQNYNIMSEALQSANKTIERQKKEQQELFNELKRVETELEVSNSTLKTFKEKSVSLANELRRTTNELTNYRNMYNNQTSKNISITDTLKDRLTQAETELKISQQSERHNAAHIKRLQQELKEVQEHCDERIFSNAISNTAEMTKIREQLNEKTQELKSHQITIKVLISTLDKYQQLLEQEQRQTSTAVREYHILLKQKGNTNNGKRTNN